MHLAEGVLPLEQAAAWSAVAAPVLWWSLRSERASAVAGEHSNPSRLLIAGATSLLFAATLLPLPVPVVGATSHLCMTPALALLVGLRRVVWPTFFVLLLQALFFAHGGLTTLGVNTLSLGLVGPSITLAVWGLFKATGLRGPIGVALACGLGGVSVYVVDACVLAVALADVASPWTTFISVVLGFAPVQLPLAVLEAVVSAGLFRLLARRRPELLPSRLGLSAVRPDREGLAALLALPFVGPLGCNYQGIDASVFGATAAAAGRSPTESLVDLSQGELGLALSIVILFSCGFVAGRVWERLLGGQDALPR